ncbi:hypothetical protein [Paramaledivibacter caminithermalis]|jgi:hypothetical protein|uniref:Uncharacterized protein n=1 Tax=Paramaledivibacter caminithermalis (strain DSM 15212 / CIP 107654 / DViRD3) TaxID=1121301 RepID=A0A1M6L664_PARC5|nr:hypothetical protein [Paramaledivibacter caminithermalis]SHJ66672.1 hypothetical protein SAMN02745912_00676 [Paramaledivibacter caminithermalis DSM 15212]
MNKNLIKKQIENFWKETLKDNYLISQIDFEKDIDKEKTGDMNYHISNDGYIRFYGKVQKESNKKDIKKIINDDKIGMINFTKIKFRNSRLLCIDALDIYNDFHLLICNKEYLEQLENQIFELNEDDKFELEKIFDSNIYGTLFKIFDTDIVIKSKDSLRTYETNLYEDSSIEFVMFDLENSQLILINTNGEKKRIYLPMKYGQEILLVSNGLSDEHIKNNIKICTEREGYFYFSKLTDSLLKNIEIAMLFKGSCHLEYYDFKRDKWIKHTQKIIKANNELKMRIKMTLGDTLYGVFFLKSKQELEKQWEKIKIFDFNNDIDETKSDMYEVDSTKGVLEFKIGQPKEIGIQDFSNIFGNATEENELIKVKPFKNLIDENNDWGDIHFDIEDYEVFYVNYKQVRNGAVCFSIDNKEPYEYLYKIQLEAQKHLLEKLLDIDSKRFEIVHTKDFIFTKKWTGVNEDFTLINPYRYNLETYNTIFINKSSNYYELNNIKVNTFNIEESLNHKKNNFRVLTIQPKGESEELLIRKILVGKERGYIYFNPVNVDKKIKIINSNTKNVVIEFYCNDTEEWIEIEKIGKYDIDILHLRAKMKSKDKIYKLIIVKDTQ